MTEYCASLLQGQQLLRLKKLFKSLVKSDEELVTHACLKFPGFNLHDHKMRQVYVQALHR